ncbi:cytochrome b5 isoform X4 [Brachypodium distachyon]|uniref:cytochrome b5 isoform X4 n=1 Tax=Brachypodium distachyon TaxID=15368 RepID=UPI00071C51C0|nr:cytochrome b5 isoform X4 [Brachypodium distachyon]|eukprot:XP_014758365.1 cytochrome b5 isoform X4 [Brachypodium distachyon]
MTVILLNWNGRSPLSKKETQPLVPGVHAQWKLSSLSHFFCSLCWGHSLLSHDPTSKTSRSYSKKEVSTHNTRKDCWIIIKKKVYDVTPYVEEHPGGNAILNNAGRVAVIQQRDFLDPNMARESSV